MNKYIQLYNQLNNDISANVFASGDKLPSEEKLAATYDVSRQTVRQALALLKKENRIYSVQGRGSFVSHNGSVTVKTKRIAVITKYLSEYIFPSILRGISDAVAESGYKLEINTTNNSLSKEREILKSFLNIEDIWLALQSAYAALAADVLSRYDVTLQRVTSVGISVMMHGYPALDRDGTLLTPFRTWRNTATGAAAEALTETFRLSGL